jgi:hypothetical protein
MGTQRRLLPETDDIDTMGFWEGTRRGELRVLECTSCSALLHMPRAYCYECGSWDNHWKTISNLGRLHSWTVIDHQVHPDFPTPYTVVLVDLDGAPGARLVGYLEGAPQLAIGQAMQARFEVLTDEVTLAQWDPI